MEPPATTTGQQTMPGDVHLGTQDVGLDVPAHDSDGEVEVPDTGTDGAAVDSSAADSAAADSAAADIDIQDSTADTALDTTPAQKSTSCADLLAQQPGAATGTYDIYPAGLGGTESVQVYCLMDVAGGGWTLVARSDESGSTDTNGGFGWFYATGSIDDFGQPYSLAVGKFGLPFSEALLGSRSGPSLVNAYRVGLPTDFLKSCATSGCAVASGPDYVMGDCTSLGAGQPRMLRNTGYADRNDHFFFRDMTSHDFFGLEEHGLETNYSDCWQGGHLDEAQGMLFVR